MRRLSIWFLEVMLLFFGMSAMSYAIPFARDINGSSVTLSNVNQWGANLSYNKVLAPSDASFSLDSGATKTFNFFSLTVSPTCFIGGGTADVTATLAFTQPSIVNVTGNADIWYAQLFGVLGERGLIWENMPKTITFSDGDGFDVNFSNILEFGFNNSSLVTASVTAHTAPIPEPRTLLLLGSGLLGLAAFRRKSK